MPSNDLDRIVAELDANERRIMVNGPPREEMTDQILLSAQSGRFSSDIKTRAYAASTRLANRLIRKGLWDQRNGCRTELGEQVRARLLAPPRQLCEGDE
jgi:hypothetical protein